MQYFQYDEKGNQTHSWYYWDDGLPTPVDYCKVTTITEYDDAGRVAGTYGDVPVHYIGREQFIANKRATGRVRDLADLEALGEAV